MIGPDFDRVLARARNGDELAWTVLYDDVSGPLLGYLRGRGATVLMRTSPRSMRAAHSSASGDVPSRTSAEASASQSVTPRPGASGRCRRGRRTSRRSRAARRR